jgi:hypothetical protein
MCLISLDKREDRLGDVMKVYVFSRHGLRTLRGLRSCGVAWTGRGWIRCKLVAESTIDLQRSHGLRAAAHPGGA